MNKQIEPKQNEPTDTTANTKNTTAGKQTASSKKASPNKLFTPTNLVAGIALVLSVISCAGVGFSHWTQKQNRLSKDQQQQTLDQAIQTITEQAKQQQSLINTQLINTNNELTALKSENKKLALSQAGVVAEIAKISTDSSQTWMLFEAKQLLKQAFFRLRASDINGASKLLEDLNEIIKQRGDLSQSASKASQAIDVALLKLQQTEQVNRADLYSQLAAIQTQMADLTIKAPMFEANEQALDKDASRWDKLANKLSSYVRIDFNADTKTLPVLTAQGVAQIKMALDLSIEKAQWAALNGQTTIYTTELNRITSLLTDYFNANTANVKAIINKLDALKATAITVEVPDVTNSFVIVNQYLDSQIETTSKMTKQKSQGANDE